MLERFTKEAGGVAAGARDRARMRGSGTVEAEHVLLALAAELEGVAGRVLRSLGLDEAAVDVALRADFEATLGQVGVSLDAFEVPPPIPLAGTPRWGTSAKAALEGALAAAQARGDRRIESAHILLAVLSAHEGTVPRALRGAGVEPADVVVATHVAMARP